MLLGLQLPHLLAGLAVERVDVARGIAEEERWPARYFATVMPERTSASTVVDQCTQPVAASSAVNAAILRAREDASAIDRGLGSQHGRIGEGEYPLRRELGHVGGGEAGIGGGLEARIIEAGRPTGPVGAVLPRTVGQSGGAEIGDLVAASAR